MSAFGFSRLDATTLVPDLSLLDLLPVLKGINCLDLVLSIFGKINAESFLPALDPLHLGPLLLLQSSSKLGFSTLLPDCSHSDVPILLHSFFYPGLFPLLFGIAAFELIMPVLDFSAVGLSMPLRSISYPDPIFPLMSLGCAGLLVFVSDPAIADSSISLRSFLQLELSASFIGNCDFDGAMSVLDYSTLGALMPVRNLGWSGSTLSLSGVCSMELPFLPLDYSFLDSPSTLQSLSYSEAVMLFCSALRSNSPAFVPDHVCTGPLAPWQQASWTVSIYLSV